MFHEPIIAAPWRIALPQAPRTPASRHVLVHAHRGFGIIRSVPMQCGGQSALYMHTRLSGFRLPTCLLAVLIWAFGLPVSSQVPETAGGFRPSPAPRITAANASGDAAEVLALERKIETAVVKGDVAFAETVLSSDFHFRHGDGWTRGEKTGGIEDDRAAFLQRIAEKEYLVHDLDNPNIEMHGDVAITWGRYVSLFMPKNRKTTSGFSCAR